MSAHLTLLELDALAEAGTDPSHAHLAECERCRNELALMRASQERFRREVFPRTAPEIERRLARRRWRWLAPLVLAPAFAVLLLTLRPKPVESDFGNIGNIGIKGAATLRVFAQSHGSVSEVREGEELAPGDALRFEIQPGGLPFLLVGSVDAAGQVGILFPLDGRESGPIDPMAVFAVPGSAVLDAAPGPERAFALLSRRPIAAEAVEASMRALAQRGPAALRSAMGLPGLGANSQLTLHWEKRSP
jgi:hypothetical protein